MYPCCVCLGGTSLRVHEIVSELISMDYHRMSSNDLTSVVRRVEAMIRNQIGPRLAPQAGTIQFRSSPVFVHFSIPVVPSAPSFVFASFPFDNPYRFFFVLSSILLFWLWMAWGLPFSSFAANGRRDAFFDSSLASAPSSPPSQPPSLPYSVSSYLLLFCYRCCLLFCYVLELE